MRVCVGVFVNKMILCISKKGVGEDTDYGL